MRYKTVKFSNLEIDDLLQEVKDGDIDVTVTEDNIDSGEATAGQVLTADGEGGAQFANPITYESKQAESGGTDVSLVTTGEKYNWDNKQDAIVPAGQGASAIAEVVGLDNDGDITTNTITSAVIDSGAATSGQVLTADGQGGAAWGNAGGGGMSNPMSAAGDIIVGGASGTPTRLAMGTAGQVLKVNAAGTGLEYGAGGGGGTQLYRHEIKLEGYNTTEYLIIINCSSASFTSKRVIVDSIVGGNEYANDNQLALSVIYHGSGGSGTSYRILGAYIGTNDINIFYVASTGVISMITPGQDTITDTVTSI